MMTVTAFGPFASINKNPSQVLASALFGNSAVVLPVSFAAVDDFINGLAPETTKLLMLGVAVGSKNMRLEREATDEIGPGTDTDGKQRCRNQSQVLRGTLLDSIEANACWTDSFCAGNFLCNYLYFAALKNRPDVSTGFLHVPPFGALPYAVQAVRLRRLVNLIESNT